MSSKKWTIILAIVVTPLAVTIALGQYRRAAAFEDRLGCVATWLEKAKALQNLQLRDPESAGRNSHRELTDQIEKAYACAIREPSHSRIAPGGGGFGQHPVLPR